MANDVVINIVETPVEVVFNVSETNQEKVTIVVSDKVQSLSVPAQGHYLVTNLYVDSVTGNLHVYYDDTPVT